MQGLSQFSLWLLLPGFQICVDLTTQNCVDLTRALTLRFANSGVPCPRELFTCRESG